MGRVVAGMDAVDAIAPGEPPAAADENCESVPRRLSAAARCASTFSISSFPRSGSRCGRRGRATARGCCWSMAPTSPTTRCSSCRDLLRPGDVLVFNDTKVIPAQLEGRRGDASIGATLHKREGPREWQAFLRNAKRARVGDIDRLRRGVHASVVERVRRWLGAAALPWRGAGRAVARARGADAVAAVHRIEARGRCGRSVDYQTMFAREEGAVAAPTAALHFTPRLLDALDARGIGRETLTLHVGAGTFLPVKADDTSGHKMHAEWGRIDAATADRLNAARASGGRLIAVGTTSLRLLESAAGEDGHDPAVRRRHRDLHHAGLSLQGDRWADHQLPSAEARHCSCWSAR